MAIVPPDAVLIDEVEASVSRTRVFDTHEHLQYESERKKRTYDFSLFLRHYASTDLLGSGMEPTDLDRLRNPGTDIAAKWEILEPYWKLAENTTYLRIISIIARDLYGVETINLEGIERISRTMKSLPPQLSYSAILREKCRIERVLNDLDNERKTHGVILTEPDAPYFLPVLRIDRLIGLYSEEDLTAAELETSRNLDSLASFSDMIDGLFDARRASSFAFKIAAPYLGRDLRFVEVPRGDAEQCYRKILATRGHPDLKCTPCEIKPFQDYIYHHCLRNAAARKLPVQIHTGLIEGTGRDIRLSNPSDLIPVLQKYPRVQFDLLHGGFPFTHELAAIVKGYPNCYLNLCWLPEISQGVYERYLDELLELLPSNKIFAFGGDYFFVEGTYASLQLAKQSITRVLARKIWDRVFSFDQALSVAERILFQNAWRVYSRQP